MKISLDVPNAFEFSYSLLVCVIGGFCGCCLIPFCIKDMRDIKHYCPECNALIGKNKGGQEPTISNESISLFENGDFEKNCWEPVFESWELVCTFLIYVLI